MEELYLNNEKRDFYLEALKVTQSCKGWQLDANVSEHLNLINQNPQIRTMYSQRGKNKLGNGMHSYLKVCYSQCVESKLTCEVNLSLIECFRDERFSKYNFQICNPRTQEIVEGQDPCLRFIGHPNYWNINHIKYELIGGNNNNHEIFWNILSKSLSKV